MKNLFKSLSLVVISLLVFSCSESPEKMIVGKWTSSDIEFTNAEKMIEQQIAQYPDSVKEMAKAQMTQTLEDQRKSFQNGILAINFKEDKKYETTSNNNAADNGTWKLSEDLKTLTTTSEKAKQDDNFKIELLEAKKMIIVSGADSDPVKMTFVKSEK